MVKLEGKTVVVVGATGQVAQPLAEALAQNNHVIGAARFNDATKKAALEAAGVRCVPIDLASADVSGLPEAPDYVLNFAVAKSNDWTRDLDAGVGGTMALVEQMRGASAFLHCSSTAVYKPMGHEIFTEDSPLGDNHGVWPFLATYSTAKIAAEAAARYASRRFGVKTTIARLSVPYGSFGGWPAIHLEMMKNGSPIPVHENAPSIYHPIHDDDIARMIPGLLDAAQLGGTTVNWGGNDAVSIEEWCAYLGELTGLVPTFSPTTSTIDSVQVDLSKLHTLVGETTVAWKDGFRRMVEARRPELLI
jgi:nucleoside-diphosphate-sugar epimerase